MVVSAAANAVVARVRHKAKDKIAITDFFIFPSPFYTARKLPMP